MQRTSDLEAFFTGAPIAWWRAAVPPAASDAEVAYAWHRLGLAPGDRVLDVPCGAGRHAVRLAALGARVTAVDLAAQNVAWLREAAREAGVHVDARRGDMLHLALERPVDAAVCLGNSLGYHDQQGTCAFLAALAAALRPGGRLLLDTSMTAESLLPLGDGISIEAGGIRMDADRRYDAPGGRVISTYRFTRDGMTDERVFVQHLWTAGELGRMLAAAGLRPESWHGDLDDTPFAPGARRLLLMARRT